MDFEKVLHSRRSIRKFLSKEVEEDKIKALVNAGNCAPSALGKMPWCFYVVQNKDALQKIKDVSMYAKYNSPMAIVTCIDREKCFNRRIGCGVESCSAAIENMLLEATNLGLGAVWCYVYPDEKSIKSISEILNLQHHLVPLNITLIGYPDEKKPDKELMNDKNVIYIK